MTDTDLTRFRYDILTVLASAPDEGMYGLAIKRALQDEYGGKEVNHGRLYPNLDTLRERGLITKDVKDPDARTNTYRITNAGVAKLEDRLNFVYGRISDGFDMNEGAAGWTFETHD